MENRFEEFIRNNREAFDSREPDPALWKKIEAGVRPRRVINWRIIASRAAAVLIIFAASYMVHEIIDRDRSEITGRKPQKQGKEIVIPELQEAEIYYSGLLSEKLDAIRPILANCPGIEEELSFEMNSLDSLYSDLKTDLKDNIANQDVVEAIIENYRLRIAILEELLMELDPEEDMCVSKINDYEL